MTRPTPTQKSDYPHHLTIPTRWSDNDVYGHVNNAVYYFYFDTVVNRWLIENGHLEIGKSETIGLVVETSCSYFASIEFPNDVIAGLRVSKIGTSSVTYEIGLFTEGSDSATAQGHFTHVYVTETTRKPTPISDHFREGLNRLCP